MDQTLVVFHKENRRVIATFRLDDTVFGARALVNPGIGYLFTFKTDIFYYNEKGEVFVKEL